MGAKGRNNRMVMANRLDAHVERYLNHNERIFGDEADMMRMFRKDAKDLQRFAQSLRDNKIRLAARQMQNMDTAVGDVIPCYIWDWVMRTAYPEIYTR